MDTIDIRRFGLAFGSTCALFYLGCVIVMATASKKATIFFFNSLLHGVDVTTIIKMHMPPGEMLMGIATTFILGWFLGATVATIYNLAARRK